MLYFQLPEHSVKFFFVLSLLVAVCTECEDFPACHFKLCALSHCQMRHTTDFQMGISDQMDFEVALFGIYTHSLVC